MRSESPRDAEGDNECDGIDTRTVVTVANSSRNKGRSPKRVVEEKVVHIHERKNIKTNVRKRELSGLGTRQTSSSEVSADGIHTRGVA